MLSLTSLPALLLALSTTLLLPSSVDAAPGLSSSPRHHSQAHRRSRHAERRKPSEITHEIEQRSTTYATTGYTYVGCYKDTSARVLDDFAFLSYSMTIEMCAHFAVEKSYPYFGLEYGDQCYMGKTMPSTAASSSSCNKACMGDSSQICGAAYIMSLYSVDALVATTSTTSSTAAAATSTATTKEWTHLGCYHDSSSARAFSQGWTDNYSMTPSVCQSVCSGKGYSYAGIEDGYQCWCTDSIASTSALVSSSSCSIKCAGDSSYTCGAAYYLDVWHLETETAVAAVVSSSSTTTTKASSTSTTATSTSKTASSSSAASTAGWQSLGCLADSSTTRTLSYGLESKPGVMSITKCQTDCAAAGYAYAGVEYGYQCWCGSAPSRTVSSSLCTTACPGDSSQMCGGAYALNVWEYVSDLAVVAAATSTAKSTSASSTSTKAATTTTSVSSTTSKSTSAVATTSSVATGWTSLGCYTDSSTSRTLTVEVSSASSMTPTLCQTYCTAKGYIYAGLEYSTQCWCGNSLGSAAVSVASSQCYDTCGGNKALYCGGSYRMNVYKYVSASTSTSTKVTSTTTSKVSSTTTSTVSSTTTKATSTTTKATSTTTKVSSTTKATSSSSTTTTKATSTSATATTSFPTVPASTATKYVWAHHIVGNTYSYTYDSWVADIEAAIPYGFDGFVLNMGTDSWQPQSVAWAYQAAEALGSTFKMMLSFDMTSFGDGNLATLQNYVATYVAHPAAAKYKGLSLLTTFAGDSNTFGEGSVTAGWEAVMGSYRSQIYFMPAMMGGPTTLTGNYGFQDADVNWGSAWPGYGQTTDLTTAADVYYMEVFAGNMDYVATLSPLFYTHLSSKNWLYRSDDFLFAYRWEEIIGMRASIDQVEVISWNDWGESHYLRTVGGDMPTGSEYYAIQDHTELMDLNAFYTTAWKTGTFPAITADRIWLMSRPHVATATASADSIGSAPSYVSTTNDKFYAQVHLTAAASVVLTAGSTSTTFSGVAGINRFSLALVAGSGISAKVVRSGVTTASITPSFTFVSNPTEYNYNYAVWSSS